MVHAAVLGRHVSAAALSSLLGRPARLELDELVRRGLLSPADGEYRFKNDMTMTVAYGMIPHEVRIQMHRSVAARIANAVGYRIGQDDALIARHLELAGDAHARGGPLPARRRSRGRARRQRRCVPPADPRAQAVARGRSRAPVQRAPLARGDPAPAREAAAAAPRAPRAAQGSRRDRRGRQARGLHNALAQFYIDVGKAPAALRAVAPALQYARDAGEPLVEAEALRLRAAIARLVGNAEESLRLVEQALELVDKLMEPGKTEPAQRTTDPVLLSRATILNQRGSTLWNMGKLEQSIESYAEALVIYRAIGMQRHEARALNNMGIVFAALGEYEEALAHYKSALKIDQALGERSGLALKLGNIGQCYSDLGDLDRAENYLGRALKVAEQTGDLSAAADTAVSWGQAKMQRGDTEGRVAAVRARAHARDREPRALQEDPRAPVHRARPPRRRQSARGRARDGALGDRVGEEDADARRDHLRPGVPGTRASRRSGRHDEAIAASDEAMATRAEDNTRIEGIEHLHRWRAEVLAAAAGAPRMRRPSSRSRMPRSTRRPRSYAIRTSAPVFLASRGRAR